MYIKRYAVSVKLTNFRIVKRQAATKRIDRIRCALGHAQFVRVLGGRDQIQLIIKVTVALSQRQTADTRLAHHHRRYNGHRDIIAGLSIGRPIGRQRKILRSVQQNRNTVERVAVRDVRRIAKVHERIESDIFAGTGDPVLGIVGCVIDEIVHGVAA